MEFLTGYRAEILDFAELLFGWYQRFLVDAACQRGGKSLEGCIRRLPPDPALWVLHLLPNHSLAFAVADPGQQLGGRFYSEDALALRDLDRFITFTDTEEEEEQQQQQKPGAGASAAPRDPRQASPTSGAPAAGRAGERRLLWGPAGAGVGRLTGGQRLTPSLPAGHPLWRVDRLLLVTDEHGSIMGFDFLLGGPLGVAGQEPLEARAIALLCQSMTCPLGAGEPRRPKQLTVGDPALSLEPLLSRLGVKLSEGPLRGWGPRPAFTFPSTRVPACHVCKRHSFEAHVAACQHCRAVLYCSERCRTLDWNRSPEDVGHRFWCQRMAGYMSRAPELADLPFTFAAEATSETFNKEGFLSARGLTRGYWAGESMLVRAPDYGVGLRRGSRQPVAFLQSGESAPGQEGGWGVALQAAPPEPPTARTFFGSWKEYYQWRGLSLSAPPAVILTYPLTLYYIITQLAPQDFPELNILNKQSLKIHVVETGKEFGVLMVFWELSVLLPHVSLELLLVGDLVPPELDGQQFLLQRDVSVHGVSVQPGLAPRSKGGRRELQLGFSARPYHLLQAPKADLVIAFNSGLALKETWRSSLPRLQSLRVPAYFTECSEYSCAVDEAAVSMATGGSASAPQINPFRSPFRQAGIDNAMPWWVPPAVPQPGPFPWAGREQVPRASLRGRAT
uniref:Zinc finger MYND-type containing 15 n=1 Tax=Varanus komodoensis TaxID=61221 RepID=A0A8D2LJ65_VARKO